MAESTTAPKLNKKQSSFVEKVCAALEAGSEAKNHVFTLSGPAGTGKTTTLVALVKRFADMEKRTLVTAPTHKAVSVLSGKLQQEVPAGLFQSSTVHSALGIRPKRVPPGQPEQFTQKSKPDLSGYSLIIIDECSMIGRPLLEFIMRQMVGNHIVVFAGDIYQLRPVGELSRSATFSPLFDETSPMKHTIHKLTKVMRHDGAILDFATTLRGSNYVPQVGPKVGKGSAIDVCETNEELVAWWLDILEHSEDAHSTIMLSFKNDNRRKLNDMARRHLFGDDVPDYKDGDYVVTLTAWQPEGDDEDDGFGWGERSGRRKFIANNAELKILSASLIEGFQPIDELPGAEFCFDSWKLKVQDEDGNTFDCYALANHERNRFKKRTQALARDIKKEVEAAKTAKFSSDHAMRAARRRWPVQYFPLVNFFLDIDFDYARTIHKSQGSTFKNVFIYDDYTESRSEAVTLAYVAFTRASEVVYHRDTRIASVKAKAALAAAA